MNMANLRDKVSNLLKTTTSTEVKAVCESFLKGTENTSMQQSDSLTESLFNNLKQINANEAIVMLNEIEGHAKDIRDIRMKISKTAADDFAANWENSRRDKKVSNVGEHANNAMRAERAADAKQERALLEQVSVLTQDASAKKYVDKAQVENYGVYESVNKIKASKVSEHAQLKYVLARFENRLSQNEPEHTMVRDFITSFNMYKWDPTVAESLRSVEDNLSNKAAVLEVQNAIYSIKSTDRKNFYSGLVSKMDEWLGSENKSTQGFIKEMKSYMFNPQVKDLVNRLLIMENAKGTHFNIPVQGTNCSVEKIHSPVISTEAGGQVFKAGNRFYHATADKIESLTEEQVNALPTSFLTLCENFFNPAVKVVDDKVTIYVGRTKVQIDENKRTYINEREIDSTTLGSQMMYHVQQTIFRNTGNLINVATTLLENIDSICEIDYGKSVFSTMFEGAGVYLFKRGEKIFINKVNSSMNENIFLEANALQTVNFVKKFLSYNLSESLAGFLEGEYKKRAEMEKTMNETLSNIKILEGQLDKIEKLIMEDPTYGDIDEVAQTKGLLENELNNLKAKWQTCTNDIRSFEILDEKKEADEPKEVKAKKEDEDEKPKKHKKDKEEKEEEEEEPKADKEEEPAEEEVPVDAPKGQDPVTEPVGDVEAANVTSEEPTIATNDAPPTDTPPTDDGGEPVTPGLDPTPTPAPVAASVVDLGLAGAAGAQPTAIQGNDHLDAGATAAVPQDGTGAVGVGFAGAEGAQKSAEAIVGGANVLTNQAPEVPVITPGGAAQSISGPAAPAGIPVSGEVPIVQATEVPATEVIGDKATATAGETGDKAAEVPSGDKTPESSAEVSVDKIDVKENVQIIEKIGVDSKVRIKESQKTGKVTAAQGDGFTVLLDDGGTADCTLEALEDLSGQIEQNVTDNELKTKGDQELQPQVEKKNEVEGDDNKVEEPVKHEETMYVKAIIALDFGPFKAGEEVDVDAAGFAASGEDTPIKLKSPKDNVSEIPKKYLKVNIAAPAQEPVV